MAANLKGLKVAILVADGFEQSELIKPKRGIIRNCRQLGPPML